MIRSTKKTERNYRSKNNNKTTSIRKYQAGGDMKNCGTTVNDSSMNWDDNHQRSYSEKEQ